MSHEGQRRITVTKTPVKDQLLTHVLKLAYIEIIIPVAAAVAIAEAALIIIIIIMIRRIRR